MTREGARRLWIGVEPVGCAEEHTAVLLEALARPEPDSARQPVPAGVLDAFAAQAQHGSATLAAGRNRRNRAGARSSTPQLGLIAKAAAATLLLSGGAVAAAAADVLPAPAQQAAHSLLGSWGIPDAGSPTHPTRHRPGPAATNSSSTPGAATQSPATGAVSAPGSGSAAASGTTCAAAELGHGADRSCPASSASAAPSAASGTHVSHPGEPSRMPSARNSNTAR